MASIGRPAPGHEPQVGRTQLGRSPIFHRPLYGTTVRCSCGWRDQANQAPSAGGFASVNDLYRLHLAEGPTVYPHN